eukprot:XP_002279602.3 PREDICTED: delta(7)-sterol-C5(6)-desaturase [Vitis vinifera]
MSLPHQSFVSSFPSQMEEYLQLFKSETDFYNQIVLGSLLPENIWRSLPHVCRTWLRNYVAGVLVYSITGFLWCFYIYYLKRDVYIRGDAIPSMKTMVLHVKASMRSLPWFAALPTFSEYAVENGWTKCFSRISEVGWFAYLVYIMAYIVFVEFVTYWIHRKLHDIKPLYKYLHVQHHSYNKQHKLSPLAGMALHPLDGLAQGAPHTIALFLVPTHLTTHLTISFFGAIWTANIHDCIDEKLWRGGYHMIHHLSNHHNYGLYTIWMDWMFGTLSHPMSDGTKPN